MSDHPTSSHHFRRGSKTNIIQQSTRELRIRLVFPPTTHKPATKIDEHPAALMSYELKTGGKPYPGTTNKEGILVIKDVPFGVREGVLTVKPDGSKHFWKFNLIIEDLDGPFNSVDDLAPIHGIKARLNNLGLCAVDYAYIGIAGEYHTEDEDGQYHRAMERFQTLFGPEPGAQRDAKWQRVKEVYGS
jgi:hypothetical protein